MRALIYSAVLIMLFGCTFSGIESQADKRFIKNGKQYGVTKGLFRDRWWNYYERALSFSEGGFYPEAENDLKDALARRDHDQWRSRSYGMHFVNYFPHRELGIIYLHQRRYTDAENELVKSLSTAESAKAKFFLNKVRKAILEESGDDKKPPAINIKFPRQNIFTNQFSLTVKGEAEDDFFVSSLTIDAQPMLLELASKVVPFEKKLKLENGTNNITIQATDLTGKIAKNNIKVFVDRKGPLISIESQEEKNGKEFLTGFLSDDSGLVSLKINNEEILPKMNQAGNDDVTNADRLREYEFNHVFDLKDGATNINLKAVDIAGNTTVGKLSIDHAQGKSDSAMIKRHGNYYYASYPAARNIKVSALNNLFGGSRDNEPPSIQLRGLADHQTLYAKTLFLEGEVSDQNKIDSLTVNGKSVLRRSGQHIFFNNLVALNEGKNTFVIEATDTFGNHARKKVVVTRKIEKVKQLGSRLSISVLPLEHEGDNSVSEKSVYDNLIAAFVNQQRFRMVEREKLEDVLQELKLSQTKLVDPATASKIGKIVVADAILTGTVHETDNSIEILTRLIDTDTTTVIDAQDVFAEDKSLAGISRLMQGLALKYRYDFPLVEGYVVKVDGNDVVTDLGANEHLRPERQLILFREGEKIRQPVTGRILGAESIMLGEATVEDVYEKLSRATITKKEKSGQIIVQDRVITK